jgi:hypothetical protein
LFPARFESHTALVGHHHHGGGGGHHHHSGGGGGGGWRGGGWGGGGGVPGRWGYGPWFFIANWPIAMAFVAVLLGYAAFDGIATYRIYAHGEHGMGVVTRVYDGTTILEVGGQVCAIDGEHGRVGGMLPVSFPPGRPGGCIVRQLSSFKWPAGAALLGFLILAAIWVWRSGALPNEKPSA